MEVQNQIALLISTFYAPTNQLTDRRPRERLELPEDVLGGDSVERLVGHLHYGISPLNRNARTLKCHANPNRSSESGVTTK